MPTDMPRCLSRSSQLLGKPSPMIQEYPTKSSFATFYRLSVSSRMPNLLRITRGRPRLPAMVVKKSRGAVRDRPDKIHDQIGTEQETCETAGDTVKLKTGKTAFGRDAGRGRRVKTKSTRLTSHQLLSCASSDRKRLIRERQSRPTMGPGVGKSRNKPVYERERHVVGKRRPHAISQA